MFRVLFVAHGMGVHGDRWHEQVVRTLNEATMPHRAALRERGFEEPLTFDTAPTDGVLVVPVRYDDVFATFWRRNAAGAQQLQHLAEQAPSEAAVALPLPELWEWLARGDPDREDFLRTHIADVLLFRLFPTIRQQVVDVFAERIASTVAALPGGLALNAISFLAHSLGTAVTQATLDRLATRPVMVDGHESHVLMLKRAPVFNALLAVANVSRVLQPRGVDVYDSCVAPAGRPDGAPCYLGEYYTFQHHLDPFLRVLRFGPAQWGESLVAPPPLQHHLEVNVHSFVHYLRHPAVHLNVVNGVYGLRPADPAYVAECTARFEAPHTLERFVERRLAAHVPLACRAALLALPATLHAIRDRLGEQSTFEDWLEAAVDFGALCVRASRVCGGSD